MRKSLAPVVFAVAAIYGSTPAPAQAQGALVAVAQSTDRAPLSNFRVHVRNADGGELAGSTTGSQAGQFSFASLQPGHYIVEIVDAGGKVAGLSPSLIAAAGSTVTVTVGATAAGALATAGGASLQDLGALASVAVAGATSPAAVTAVVATRDGRPVVCHKLSATSSMTLAINETARDGHVGHGDTLGACPTSAGR
jgi:hypothetical protein